MVQSGTGQTTTNGFSVLKNEIYWGYQLEVRNSQRYIWPGPEPTPFNWWECCWLMFSTHEKSVKWSFPWSSLRIAELGSWKGRQGAIKSSCLLKQEFDDQWFDVTVMCIKRSLLIRFCLLSIHRGLLLGKHSVVHCVIVWITGWPLCCSLGLERLQFRIPSVILRKG